MTGVFVSSHVMTSSKDWYKLTVPANSWAFISIVQPKKRANTTSKYWYADPSLIVMKRKIGATDWQSENVTLSGFTRSTTIEVFLDPAHEFCCIPFSCKMSEEDAPFTLAVYSAKQVVVEITSKSREVCNHAVLAIHRTLLNDERRLHYPLGDKSALVCVHGHRCLYFVAVNGSLNSFALLRLVVKVPKGVTLSFGSSDQTYNIPPRTQKILVIVASEGRRSNATSIDFSFVTDMVDGQGQALFNISW